jgi:hypothetical protein
MPLVDFPAVRRLVPMRTVLELLSYTPCRRKGDKARGPCPLGCSRSPRHCSIDLARGLWKCHHCRQGGNHLDLYARVKQLPLYVAAVELCQKTGQGIPRLPAPPGAGASESS